MAFETEIGKPSKPFPLKGAIYAVIIVVIAAVLYLAYTDSPLLNLAKAESTILGLFGSAIAPPADQNAVQVLRNVSLKAELQVLGTNVDLNNALVSFSEGGTVEQESQRIETGEGFWLEHFSGIAEYNGRAIALGSASGVQGTGETISFKTPQSIRAEGTSLKVEHVSIEKWIVEGSGSVQSGALNIALDGERIEIQEFSGIIWFDLNGIGMDGNAQILIVQLKDKNVQVE
ncbi:MAG: hypothetical protein V1847_05355 [Candidatus Diapherotrites archaeon]